MAVHLGHAYRPIDPKPRACMIEVHEIILGNRTLEAREPSRAEVHDCEVMLGADPRPVYAFVGDLHPELGRVGLVVSRGWAVLRRFRVEAGEGFPEHVR